MSRAPCEEYSGSREYGPCRSRTSADTDTADSPCINLWVLYEPAWLWLVEKQSRGFFPDFATSNAQSTRHGPRPGPKLESCVHAPPLRAPRPRARKRPAAGREKLGDAQKKDIFVHYDSKIYWSKTRD